MTTTPAPEWAINLRAAIPGERIDLDAALAVERAAEDWDRANVAVRVGILDYAASYLTADECAALVSATALDVAEKIGWAAIRSAAHTAYIAGDAAYDAAADAAYCAAADAAYDAAWDRIADIFLAALEAKP